MKKLVDMSRADIYELLQRVIDEDFFDSHKRLMRLLNAPPSAESEAELVAEFREFFCGYTCVALWLEEYEENPLQGLDPHTTLAKKLRRHLDYIHANRKTTLDDRMDKRMGIPLESESMPEIKVSELPPAEFRELLRVLVAEELFSVLEQVVALLQGNPSRQQLDVSFRELFVAYELFELVLDPYHYDPDEGLELRPEVAAEIDQSIADYESGKVKAIPIEEVAKELGLDWGNVSIKNHAKS